MIGVGREGAGTVSDSLDLDTGLRMRDGDESRDISDSTAVYRKSLPCGSDGQEGSGLTLESIGGFRITRGEESSGDPYGSEDKASLSVSSCSMQER